MLIRATLAIVMAVGTVAPTLAQTGTGSFVGSCEAFYNASQGNCECILNQISPSLSAGEINFLGQNMAANSGGSASLSSSLLVSDDRVPQINEILQTAAGTCLPVDTLLREGFNNG